KYPGSVGRHHGRHQDDVTDPVRQEVQNTRYRDSREGVADQHYVPQILRLDVLTDRISTDRESDRAQADVGPCPAARKVDCQRLRIQVGDELVPAVRAEAGAVDENE